MSSSVYVWEIVSVSISASSSITNCVFVPSSISLAILGLGKSVVSVLTAWDNNVFKISDYGFSK